MSYSPWGEIQNSASIIRGVREVSAGGHGGIMVSKSFAEKNFTQNALKRSIKYDNYYCYEEDCDYAIAMFELKKYWKDIFKEKAAEEEKSILETLSAWNADYLIELGVTPVEPQYSFYKECELRHKLEEEKSPDLIIAAWGTWHTKIPGVIKVATADDKYYHIKEDSYKKDSHVRLLSQCVVLEQVGENDN